MDWRRDMEEWEQQCFGVEDCEQEMAGGYSESLDPNVARSISQYEHENYVYD